MDTKVHKKIKPEDKHHIKRKIFPMFNDVSRKAIQNDKQKKTFKYVFNKIRLRKCASAAISRPFPTYQVAYLGNVVTGWAKGEGCIEKPLTTLWRNYIQSSRSDVSMQLTVSGGLKAVTKSHGLTEYWAHRLTTCAAPAEFPRIFCWIYRHEARRLKHELRCHAVLCISSEVALQIERELKDFLRRALTDFKKEKLSRQNARLSLVNCINENASLPRRKILLAVGHHNYRPPLECSKSAPKLSSIEEIFDEEEDDLVGSYQQIYRTILKSHEQASYWFERGKYYQRKKPVYDVHKSVLPTNCDQTPEDDVEEDTSKSNSELGHRVTFVDEPAEVIVNSTENLNQSIGKQSAGEGCTSDLDQRTDFKIGGEIHTFVNPILSKGLMDQEQVSLVPVGEPLTDFSSLKVYKKRHFSDGCKDFSACTMFLSGETVNQLEHIFQTHCSFSTERDEDEFVTKLNSTVTT